MTPRERVIAAARGGEVDRKPVICWPTACAESDVDCGDLSPLSTAEPARLRLVPVLNPFGQALKIGTEIGDVLADDPDEGERQLSQLIDKSRAEMTTALTNGADGIFYLLYGARAVHTTPMEYGGHFLERDRELLTEIQDAAFNMIFVVGEDDAYLDFVSDLPAHAFGWDAKASSTPVSEMRKMRTGALATNAGDADIELRFGTESPSVELEIALQDSTSKLPTQEPHAV